MICAIKSLFLTVILGAMSIACGEVNETSVETIRPLTEDVSRTLSSRIRGGTRVTDANKYPFFGT